ncbi:hypothetical protein SBOR_9589 [Sclerotinia borealis F-4128]|uniref:Uncharacterized protein n=1 Tax=Sclerotinia borealis (strain F-4128) TaxID=1432307 RepID=W9C2V1_SCLBF|nr:hypothetical protein SBOR_9589 [Sclerotinia borealis F-4128]
MTHTTKENVEILVHTSAPSRGQDDARYRAFVRAYLDFKPATHTQLQDDPEAKTVIGEGFKDRIFKDGTQEELQHSTEEYDENASYCPPTQDPETNPGAHQNEITDEELSDLMYSPQLSFRSVLDNRNSPMFRTRSRTIGGLGILSGEEMSRQSQFMDSPARRQSSSIIEDSLSASRQPFSVIEDSMPDNNRILPQYSSPTRILEALLQQGESTQDSPEKGRKSPFTDESSLNLEVPQAIPFSSSQNEEAHNNSDIVSSLSPRRSQADSPPRRLHTTRYRHITSSPISTSNTDAPNAMISDGSNNIPASGRAANISNRRTSQTVETGDFMEPSNRDMTSDKVLRSGPISSLPEIPETSCSLPQNANSKRRRVDFPSSIDESPRSPKRVKLVISDTTAETFSASFPATQLPPTSTALEAPVIPSSMPPMSSLPSPDSLATCTIPSVMPPTSSCDFTPASLITHSLGRITSNQSLQKRFKPTLQTRSCRPFERGYWLINTQELKEQVRQNLWSYLFRHISGGHTGWGVSAERTEDWKSVRVNCWGGVVKEIYLLLFLASEGKMKGSNACWKDGDGETVISWT